MTSAAKTWAGRMPVTKQLGLILDKIRREDSVSYLSLFLAVYYGFSAWYYVIGGEVFLLLVLLVPALIDRPLLWGILASLASVAVFLERDLADNHKYLLCYWMWVMCIAHVPGEPTLRDRIISFNARFFLIFIFLAAALQKIASSGYMSNAMFELHLLLDERFRAFVHLVGIDAALGDESLRRVVLLNNPYVQVLDSKIVLATSDYVHFVARLVTLYDLYVQVAIGVLFLFCRRVTDILAHCLLLFFIFTTYIPAPVFGFGLTLSVLGYALAKDRSQVFSAAYIVSVVAILFYQAPWRDWVLAK